MTPEQILDELTTLIRETVADPSIVVSRETVAEDVEGWDSIAHVVLIVAVEARFGIRLSVGETAALANVGVFVDTIARHLRAGG